MGSSIIAFVWLSLVLGTFIGFGSAIKTATWPPRILLEHYDFKGLVDKCLAIHKPDVKKIEEFERSDDFDHLPDDRAIKCYFHCLYIEFELMKPNSTVIDPTKFVGIMNEMTEAEQSIYLKMFRKCNKKNKDLCDMVYQLQVCMKKNDNEHYYMAFDHDWMTW